MSYTLSPPTGASQTDRERGVQGYVPIANHLQGLENRQVERTAQSHMYKLHRHKSGTQ